MCLGKGATSPSQPASTYGIGEATIATAIREVIAIPHSSLHSISFAPLSLINCTHQATGVDATKISSLFSQYGDIGDVAFSARSKQSTLIAIRPFTVSENILLFVGLAFPV